MMKLTTCKLAYPITAHVRYPQWHLARAGTMLGTFWPCRFFCASAPQLGAHDWARHDWARTTDEGPTVAEKTRLATDGPQKFGQQGSNFVVECEAPSFCLWPIIWTASAFLSLAIIALLVQWHFFRRKLIRLGTYAPNCSSGGGSVQFEMAGMPSFLGTTPNPVVAINGKYGRIG
uniref:Uncharacterized protein n=1 Tax=Globodera pallida TaxID=36090 RepID=A0A183CJ01_GLOPA